MNTQIYSIFIEFLGLDIDLTYDLHLIDLTAHRKSPSWWNESDTQTRPKPSFLLCPMPSSSSANNDFKTASFASGEQEKSKTEPVSMAYSLVFGVPHKSLQPITRRILAA